LTHGTANPILLHPTSWCGAHDLWAGQAAQAVVVNLLLAADAVQLSAAHAQGTAVQLWTGELQAAAVAKQQQIVNSQKN